MRVVFRKGPEAQVQPGDTAFTTRVKPDTIIDGRHTEHWRITSHATMRMKIVGDLSSSTTTDTYISTEMTDYLRFVGPGGGQQALFAGEAYARKQEAARAQLPQGLEVLTITQSVVGGGPVSRTFVKTRRLSDIRYADIPAEVFAVPAGYERVAPPIDPPSGSSRARSN